MSMYQTLDALASHRMRDIEAKKEQYLAAWLAEHGAKPSECALVVRYTINGYELYVRKLKEGER